ncbi:MAG: hypothetical protein ABTQ31_20025 [Rhizobiaceae bacterium]
MLEIGHRRQGATSDGKPVALAVGSAQRLTQIAGWGDFEPLASALLGALGLTFPAAYDRATVSGAMRAFRIAPDRLLVQSPEPLNLRPANGLAVLDLTHARLLLRVAGPGAAALLARAAAIDFSQKVFATGTFVQTAIHGVAVLIQRPEAEAFELFVPGTWAQSVFEFLTGHLLKTEAAH